MLEISAGNNMIPTPCNLLTISTINRSVAFGADGHFTCFMCPSVRPVFLHGSVVITPSGLKLLGKSLSSLLFKMAMLGTSLFYGTLYRFMIGLHWVWGTMIPLLPLKDFRYRLERFWVFAQYHEAGHNYIMLLWFGGGCCYFFESRMIILRQHESILSRHWHIRYLYWRLQMSPKFEPHPFSGYTKLIFEHAITPWLQIPLFYRWEQDQRHIMEHRRW